MKVPKDLRKSLYDYLKREETGYVEDLIKSAFPENNKSKNKDNDNKKGIQGGSNL